MGTLAPEWNGHHSGRWFQVSFDNGSFESDYDMRKLGMVLLLTIGWGNLNAGDDKVAQWIETIRSVGAQGRGSLEARAARTQLAGRGPEILRDLLVGMDTPDIVSSNWLRSVFDEIVDRTWAHNPKLIPDQEFRDFFMDSRREGRVRRLVLSVLARRDPEFPGRIIPGLVEDPEFRFDAIDHLLKQAKRRQENNESEQAITLFQRACEVSRDENQIRTAAEQLAVPRKGNSPINAPPSKYLEADTTPGGTPSSSCTWIFTSYEPFASITSSPVRTLSPSAS